MSEEYTGEMLIYQTEDGESRIECRLLDETVWLSQGGLAELFETTKQNISLHVKNIMEEGELVESSVVKESLTTASDGKRYKVKLYNLDMIIAIGYRVRSTRGTQFRQWATERLREYIVKGFTMDDERLKGTDRFADYFDELLARIREIRASEARVYQRIRDIFALAVDYDDNEATTKTFFATMQNKVHYAATGSTAAEILKNRAKAELPNMGLTNWKGERVIKRDVGTAKNYFDAEEIDTLNRIVVMFLDQAEFRAQRRQNIRMADWEGFLDKFLRDTELPILEDAGSISHKQALSHAEKQYDAFSERRRLEAENAGEARYIDDLRETAREIEAQAKQKKKPAAKNPKKRKK